MPAGLGWATFLGGLVRGYFQVWQGQLRRGLEYQFSYSHAPWMSGEAQEPWRLAHLVTYLLARLGGVDSPGPRSCSITPTPSFPSLGPGPGVCLALR